jgi:hypothetical protein
MTFIRNHSRVVLVGAACTGIGAGASVVAGAGAATPAGASRAAGHSGQRANGLRRLAKHAVQGDLVVKTKNGFVTVTFARGKVDSVDGQRLTMTESTQKASYKTVTLTIPGNAVVQDDRHRAVLSDLKPGQKVTVVQAPNRTLVAAHTPKAG